AGGAVRTLSEARRAAEEIGYPVILKPCGGSKGRGFSGCLMDEEALRRAWAEAAHFGGLLVEKFVVGRDYRLLVVNGRMIAAAERIGARVVGDGVRTLDELIGAVNADPRRGDGHEGV